MRIFISSLAGTLVGSLLATLVVTGINWFYGSAGDFGDGCSCEEPSLSYGPERDELSAETGFFVI